MEYTKQTGNYGFDRKYVCNYCSGFIWLVDAFFLHILEKLNIFCFIHRLNFETIKIFVDIYSRKFPIIIIIILVGILVLQYMSNDNNNPMIDSETCELYIEDSQFNGKKYLNEYDSKCLDFKNLNP